MIEFPHKPPLGYTYEQTEFKRNVVAIWIRNHRKFDYNGADSVRSIWGFYNTKTKQYFAPINSSKCGNTVAIEDTTPYTAMPLLKVAQDPPATVPTDPIMTTVQTKDMTATFAEFQAEQDARNTIQLNVIKWCYMLTDALRQNYIETAIRGHKNSLARLEGNTETGIQYHKACIADLTSGRCPIDYVIESGKKYHKIILVDGGGQRSVHAFVDKKTGEVYKSASWKAPAKGVRYDLRLITDREWLLENADWSGGYLYAR